MVTSCLVAMLNACSLPPLRRCSRSIERAAVGLEGARRRIWWKMGELCTIVEKVKSTILKNFFNDCICAGSGLWGSGVWEAPQKGEFYSDLEQRFDVPKAIEIKNVGGLKKNSPRKKLGFQNHAGKICEVEDIARASYFNNKPLLSRKSK
jgi:hypothetical protein